MLAVVLSRKICLISIGIYEMDIAEKIRILKGIRR
jgi:hypothetical protein